MDLVVGGVDEVVGFGEVGGVGEVDEVVGLVRFGW